jgi:hypothetical protein
MDIYEVLKRDRESLKGAEASCSIDHFLGRADRVKISSMDDLLSFVRISEDTLVHKAQKDLWRINNDGNGGMVIERLFDPSSKQPIRV